MRPPRSLWAPAILGIALVACTSSSNPIGTAGDAGTGPQPDATLPGQDMPADAGTGTGNMDAQTQSEDAGDAASGDCDGSAGDACVATEPEPTCGDGLINVAGEQCDDGNAVSDDGCTATCVRDPDYDCPAPGQPCVSTVECGDSKISGSETCDDGDAVSGDGCSETCQLEAGYDCPLIGLPCQAAECGDGIVAGLEECDFVDPTTGCTGCRIDAGYDCDGAGCNTTECGNGVVERGEQCDDGQGAADSPFDGCYNCQAEPVCNGGVCTPVCGDGQRFAGEACDDGNLRSGDGCSQDCQVETAFSCEDLPGEPPENVSLPIVLRDFIGRNRNVNTDCDDPIAVPDTTNPCHHIDFNGMGGGFVQGVLENELDENGRPVYVCPDPDMGCSQNPGQQQPNGGRFTFNGPDAFYQWYDSSSPNAIEVVSSVTLDRQGDVYVFDSAPAGGFYPVDGAGWVAEGLETSTNDCSGNPGKNVSFTSETHFWFEYQGGEQFEFVGDDDLWVFVDGRLILDLGGLHGALAATFTLGPIDDGDDGSIDVQTGSVRASNPAAELDLGLAVGGVYEVVMFHAERNQCGSNFKVTLKDFNRPRSACASECGDGEVASDEVCDAGDANADPAPYGGCSADCRQRGPFCGDGITDTDQGEACDDGFNISVYGQQAGDCAPDCKLPAFCGDGIVQSVFGEQCDDGVNDGSYGNCAPDCVVGPRCGDGEVQADGGEECDDGNLENFDGCNVNCRREIII